MRLDGLARLRSGNNQAGQDSWFPTLFAENARGTRRSRRIKGGAPGKRAEIRGQGRRDRRDGCGERGLAGLGSIRELASAEDHAWTDRWTL